MSECLFCRIVRGELPGRKVYEDEEILAFHDIHPAAPVHFMIIPKAHRDSLIECTAQDEGLLGKMLGLAPRLAQEQGLKDGFRIVINTGPGGGQEIYHLHIHIMGGIKSSPLPRSGDK
ncbi:histidine triad nucleotide-binding protein [Ferrovum myxofaciens]|jgi:histidine triad (HIT) family protein|uniref:HIT-like protein n=2 Tax=root TaxID=1 RepID=A0A859A8V5_9PROT|nr:histidine triad nucleotide-binding protein [Ferrovum myxofaciens]MBW8028850.1 HIT domain-containing protein [Ferrovum sp.]KXW59220.1 HIT-like protein [Ferrovum myxofaciens]MBU6994795.1 histidine triad nucleotide-binding protein [Ferrovum myxofaciens]NDU90105.1 histidine triad nucleotide-binding protein [Ferrovum sp.]QKE38633.1 MAG: histidine triad nucleotide-binding protein [Ferrovum myxofaciens]